MPETTQPSLALRPARLALATLALATAACQTVPADAATADAADLILTNGKVYTVEPGQPWAQAVAVKDGKIEAVGSAEEIAAYRGADTRVVDLAGRVLMPAFGDAHVHPLMGGQSHSGCTLEDGKTVDDYLQTIRGCVANTPGNGTIFGIGWHDGLFPPDGVPRKELLDAISKDRPLIFGSNGGHSLWVNSKALELAGITKDTPDPLNGHIDRDATTGEPSGGLQESAQDLVADIIPPVTQKDIEQAITYTAHHFNQLGITNWHDALVEVGPGGTSDVIDAYKAVKDRGDLTAHVRLALKWKNDEGLEQLGDLFKAREHARQLGIQAESVKFFVDGVIVQKTAAMLEPYEDSHDRGEAQITPEMLDQAVTRIDAKGMQAHFHSIGDRAVRMALDAVEASRKVNGPDDTRPMISHLNVIEPADQPRFGELNVTAVFQPLWACIEPYMNLTIDRIGPERAQYIYPAGSVLRDGGRLAYGSDWPVASANPFDGIEVALTRRDPYKPDDQAPPLLPGQAVTLQQAIAAYTIDVAYVNHMEDKTGSIAPGKDADMIVLDRDLFSLPPRDISDTKVLVTLFGGREVFGKLSALEN